MADNVGYTPGTGATVAADDIGGVLHQRVKIGIGADGSAVDLSSANPMPITAPSALDVAVNNFPASQAVTGPLTDAQLRAADVPTSDAGSQNLLLRILQMLMAPLGYDKSLGRQRGTVVVESGTVATVTTVTTVTTVSSLSNIAAIGGYSAQMQVFDANRTAWALGVRARIT